MSDRSPHRIPALGGPLASHGFVEASGRRSAFFGRERGPFEWWAWPLKIASDLRLTLHLPGTSAPIALEALPGHGTVSPGELVLVHEGDDFLLRQTIVADRERAVLLWLLELEGRRELDAELACTLDLRPMWPAGLGGQLALRDPVTGALTLSEETGRFAAFLGAVGGRVRDAPDGRGVPRRPIRLAARLRPGETTPIVFAAAQGNATSPSRGSRLGRGQAAAGTSSARGVVDRARDTWREVGENWSATLDATRASWSRFDAGVVRLRCADADLERAFGWSQAVVERSRVRVDGLGTLLVAGLAPSRDGDRPGFAWSFDTDALFAAQALAGLGRFTPAAEALWGAASRQRADGKLAHETVLSAKLCDWFERYPYAYYRGTTAAQFAQALDRYVRASGDEALGRALLPALERALDWLWSARGESGLVTTSRAGLGAVQSGPLSEVIECDAYLHGGLFAGLRAAARLAHWLGESELERRCIERATQCAEAFEQLWSQEHGCYAFAITREGRSLDDRAALIGLPLAAGLGSDERALAATLGLCHPELATDWGLRLLGEDAPHFHPDNYNSGAVLPLSSVYAALACYRVGHTAAGHQLLGTLVKLEGLGGRGLVEEHLPGDRARLSPRRVPRHLVSSTALLTTLVDGALGLELDAARGQLDDRVSLRLQHPLPWSELALDGLRVGARPFDLTVSRRSLRDGDGARTQISARIAGEGSIELVLAAVLPAGSEVLEVVDGEGAALDFELRELVAGTRELRAQGTRTGVAVATLRQGPHLRLPVPTIRRDRESQSARPVAFRADDRGLELTLAGAPDSEVELGLTCDLPLEVRGAERARRSGGAEYLRVHLPASDEDRYARTTVELRRSDR
ncbi:amylo-alpha-1,6-glucosidase [Engelhardtia mirabilis]|uniref:Mannosylglycerate hydrolase MGH1-like glycoside hydrolase domain-containing protein n=1 Tax=Engelhardtia mirabilis TaxID=2528011 RepID=A0A518BQA6_9BACT|nr:hypothetical protein Pla133_42690 [Planctomycetes bacterium Pla133]QDV03480.1 hypothetical protein Pla86_42680 [Planctomycetes bacterium Pla86]